MWRGLAPYGVPRTWQEISYHERLGIVEIALNEDLNHPELVIKKMFQLARLNETTKLEFIMWVENYRNYLNSKS